MKLFMRIRVARHNTGLSQEALARKIGVTRGAVANWECTDGVIPAAGRLGKIARITDVSYEWLATGRGHVRPHFHPDRSATSTKDTELGDDAIERRLLAAFRATPAKGQKIILELVESSARKATG